MGAKTSDFGVMVVPLDILECQGILLMEFIEFCGTTGLNVIPLACFVE